MKKLLPALAFMAPLNALAAAGGNGNFSFASSLVQMLGSLAVVLGIIYLITHFFRNWLKGKGVMGGVKSNIRIVETRHLAPKKSLLLVEVAGEYLLLSNGAEGVSFIKQIDMLEEIEVVEVLGPEGRSKGLFQDKLEGIISRMNLPRPLALPGRNQA
jgi:flagellar protein FliO/FliZ